MKTKCLLIAILILAFSTSAYAQKKLMLFGGENHDVYLGCFNCSEIAPDSIHNDISKYGSNINPNSIFNDIGQYGSDLSMYSPCNEFATYPPVLVDEDGGFYGYLAVNEFKPKAITDPDILNWLKYKVCKN
jgi:hypothetical protein